MREAPYRIILTQEVADDLSAIFEIIATHSPGNASAFIARILADIELLAAFPIRPVVPDQPPSSHPVRKVSVDRYNVYYRVMESERVVRVVRVVHGARQQPSQFN